METNNYFRTLVRFLLLHTIINNFYTQSTENGSPIKAKKFCACHALNFWAFLAAKNHHKHSMLVMVLCSLLWLQFS